MRNLEGRDPNLSLATDLKYVKCIRRAALDAMAGKAKSTVQAHVDRIRENIRVCKMINRTPRLPHRGPMPMEDIVGMGWAVDLLMKYLTSTGRVTKHIQFDTMRQLRSTFTKMWSSSPRAIDEGASFSGNAAKVRFTSCPSQSEWFGDFLIGAEDRMGYDTKKQLYLPIAAVIDQLNRVKRDATDATTDRANLLYKFGALIAILTAASLRGHEGLYLDLAATRNHLDKGRFGSIPPNVMKKGILTEKECGELPEVCICLIGKFKGETGERYHSIVLANTSQSGLETRWWIEKLMEVCESEGRMTGYAFADQMGQELETAEFNALVRHYLQEMRSDDPDKYNLNEDMARYGISRTYRKASESRARRAGIKEEEVTIMNRWHTFESAKGRRPRQAMIDHYADAKALSSVTWKYSYAL